MNSVNTFPIPVVGRRPRAIVKVGGTAIPGWIEWSVTNNSYSEADTFEVSFSMSALPAAHNANWFSQQTEIFVEILAGFPSNPSSPNAAELTSLIYGRVDDIRVDPVRGVLTLPGRDLTAVFIDTKLTTQYQNKKATQIVRSLANGHGLDVSLPQGTTATVESPALSPPGTYDTRGDQVRLQLGSTEWDLISWLARENGLVAFVQGKTLNFIDDQRKNATPYLLQWQPLDSANGSPRSNVIDLDLSRSLTVAKGITVTVRSTNFLGQTIARSYPKSPRGISPGASSPFGGVQPYFFNVRNKTPEQVEALAQAKFEEISSHAMKLRATLPADALISLETPVQLQGTGTAYDQTYFVRAVTRRMSVDEGYVMEIEAQNTTPELLQAATSR